MSEPIALPLGERTVTDVFAEDDFDAFVAARGQKLVRMARGLLRDPQHAEDVVQEVLVKAHQHWSTICSRESPEAYVRRMLVNASTSFWRRAARKELSVDSGAWPVVAAPDESARIDERDRILAALRRLPPKQRAVIVLRHYEGLADEEIAAVMGTSEVTVRTNIHRGLANLRGLLAEAEREPERASEGESAGRRHERHSEGRSEGRDHA
jgi:RNA polymerase sigma-70 factor (sigma-E family)